MSQNKYQELPRSSVHCREALGEGEFGSVYRGEWQSPMGCVEVAVKVSKDGLDPSEKVKLLQEAAVMGQFLHPRVLRLFGVVKEEPVSCSLYTLNGISASHKLPMFTSTAVVYMPSFPQSVHDGDGVPSQWKSAGISTGLE